MTFLLGLTGSIGMGKSTTAKMFVAEGCALWDADAAVHQLYAKGGAAVAPMAAVFPSSIQDGSVSRERLKDLIKTNPENLKKIEDIVHPLVAQDRQNFTNTATADITVLDIPLLYETGAADQMDAVVVVSTDPQEQRKRLLERGQMSPEQFNAIIQKQMPDSEKRAKADYVIITDTLESARAQVQDMVAKIRADLADA